MRVSISRAHFPIHALGPGKRLGIWFQGCSIRCPGCISTDTWAATDPDIEVQALIDQLRPWIEACEGITISGGEPFDQPEALTELVRGLKKVRQADILVFSGHTFDDIGPHLNGAEPCIDAVITEPFLIAHAQTLALRGSDNQQIHFLTNLGRERFAPYERQRTAVDDRLDLMMDEDGSAYMAGIPKRGDLIKLKSLLLEQGHTCRISEAPSSTTGARI